MTTDEKKKKRERERFVFTRKTGNTHADMNKTADETRSQIVGEIREWHTFASSARASLSLSLFLTGTDTVLSLILLPLHVRSLELMGSKGGSTSADNSAV